MSDPVLFLAEEKEDEVIRKAGIKIYPGAVLEKWKDLILHSESADYMVKYN